MDNRTFTERCRPWVPALLWVAVIAWESTGIFTAENTAGWLYSLVSAIFGKVDLHQVSTANAVLRKVGHFTGYAILAYFFYRGWQKSFAAKLRAAGRQLRATGAVLARTWRASWAAYAVLMTIGVASLDELHQTTLPGRTGTWHDVVLDGVGAVFAQVLLLALASRRSLAISAKEEDKVVST